jgi:hypothetical protein
MGGKEGLWGARGTEKKCFCFVGEAQEKQTNKRTNETKQNKRNETKRTKTKNKKNKTFFFWVGGQRTSYVIRREDKRGTFTSLRNKVKQASDQTDDGDDDE